MPDLPPWHQQPGVIRDDYAGPGGWSDGLRRLGLTDVGVEWVDGK